MKVGVAVLGLVAIAGAAFGAGADTKLEIGKETTRVERPLLPDGTVDYGAALWERMSEGVTEENNAEVLFRAAWKKWKRFGSEATDEKQWDAMDATYTEAQQRPWKEKEFPEVAAFLKENEEALRDVVAASKRERWCPEKPAPAEWPTWKGLGHVRVFGLALLARGMEEVADGKYDAARDDVEAMGRLMKLMTDQPDLLGVLTAYGMEGELERSELGAVRAMPAKEGRAWLATREEGPVATVGVAAVNVGERYEALENVMLMLQGKGGEAMQTLTFLDVGKWFGKGGEMPGDLGVVDWNVVLRRINVAVDEAMQIASQPDLMKRYADAEEWSARLKAAKAPGNVYRDVMVKPALSGGEPPTSGKTAGQLKEEGVETEKGLAAFIRRRDGETMQAFSERIANWFATGAADFGTAMRLDRMRAATRDVYTVAMAVEVYRKETGAWPENLDALVPGELHTLPVDLFSGKRLVYRREAGGYVIYSLGANGKNDGGRPGGDVVVRGRE